MIGKTYKLLDWILQNFAVSSSKTSHKNPLSLILYSVIESGRDAYKKVYFTTESTILFDILKIVLFKTLNCSRNHLYFQLINSLKIKNSQGICFNKTILYIATDYYPFGMSLPSRTDSNLIFGYCFSLLCFNDFTTL